MATLAVAALEDMERFVKGLFQGSPDLSTLTHAIVRKKYLTHIGKETLMKEEKVQLKRLIEKELLQIQVEDSGDEVLLAKLKPADKSTGQKRTLCISDSSGEEVERKHKQKKRRTVKELELSSDEGDSGIDSKKARDYHGLKNAGKSLSGSDHRDSGAEGHADATGSEEEESMKNTPLSRRTDREKRWSPSVKGQRSGGKGERSESEGEESQGGQGSDVEEEVSKIRKATKHQNEEPENDPENDLKECKLQKRKGMDTHKKEPGRMEKAECRKENKQRGKRETESEDESDLSETHGKRRTDWSDSEKERAGGDGRKAKPMGGPRGRKAREQSQGEDESDCALREKQKTQRKVMGYRHRKKDASVEESESDSDYIEGKGQMKKDVCRAKSQRVSAEKLRTNGDSEDALKKKVKIKGMKKTQGRGMNRKELEGNQKRRNPIKQQGGHKPKRSVSRKESGSETGEETGSEHSSASENESQSEAEHRGKGKKQSKNVAVSRDDSESGSEETAGVTRRQKRMSEERKVKKEVFGSDSSEEEEEEPKNKGTEKSHQESVSKSESDSEDSGSKSAGKVKNKRQQEKRTQKPKGRSNSKEEIRNESDEEEHSSLGDEDTPRSSKKQHQGKDKEHRPTKGEDHPSVQRLKRYIRECGVRRNYKKLFLGCRSRKARLEVLKQELENLGLKGTPTLAKCKALKKKLEEAAEVASLDLSNIIAAEGRPKRRNVWSLYSKPEEATRSPEDSPIRRRATDWSRLRGVISSDDESD